MRKINVCIIFGGESYEREISFATARAFTCLNDMKFNQFLIGIDPDGWYMYTGDKEVFSEDEYNMHKTRIIFTPNNDKLVLMFDGDFHKIDICLIAVHGSDGEDGNLQGFLNMCRIPYIGSGCLSSGLCYDKRLFKELMDVYELPQTNWKFCTEEKNNEYESLKFPLIIKPSRCGSSLGITIAENKFELEKGIQLAKKYDSYIILEEFREVIEIECAVLTTKPFKCLPLSQVNYKAKIYDFNAKYNDESTEIIIPAPISVQQYNYILKLAEKVGDVFNLNNMYRIDFFIDKNNNEVLINEINTQPGVASDDMGPNLWGYDGLLSNTLEYLIEKCLII